jgi:hypothetical protein
MDQMDASAVDRPRIVQSLARTLQSQMRPELLDDAIFENELKHKKTVFGDQANLVRKYRKLQSNNFETVVDRSKFLGLIYGQNSPIASHQREAYRIHQSEAARYGFNPNPVSTVDNTKTRSVFSALEEEYLDNVQRLISVGPGSWTLLSSAMRPYCGKDFNRKVQAAKLLQRAVRRFLNSPKHFTFERAMRQLDQREAERIRQEEIQRRKLQYEHEKMLEILHRREGIGTIVASTARHICLLVAVSFLCLSDIAFVSDVLQLLPRVVTIIRISSMVAALQLYTKL